MTESGADTIATPRTGFRTGIGVWWPALRFLAGRPSTWPAASVPVAVLALLLTILGVALRYALWPMLAARFVGDAGSAAHYGGLAIASLLTVAVAVGGMVLALALTPPLSAPALERLVGARERALGVPERRPLGVLAEIGCGLRAQLLGLSLSLPLLVLLLVLDLLIAPLAPLWSVLKLVVTALGVAWNLVDYPLSLWGVGARARLRFLGRHRGAVFGFGICFALLLYIPCCGVLGLPLGAVAATELVWRLVAADPHHPSELAALRQRGPERGEPAS